LGEILPGIAVDARVVETAAGAVEYQLTPGDGPVVLASHGGWGGLDQARVLLHWLDPARYRLLSVSRPGYLGTPLASGRTMEEQADLFAALLDALEIDSAAVIALSSGGPPGYLLGVRHPDRVWAIVAIAAVTGPHEAPETAGPIAQALFTSRLGQLLMEQTTKRRSGWMLRQLFRGESHLTKRQIEANVQFVLGAPDALAFLRAFMEAMSPYAPRRPGTDNDSVQQGLLTRLRLEEVRCPTLVVHGTHDADVNFSDGVYAHELIPSAERYWIEAGSHLGFWLSPHAEEAQGNARDFLDRYRVKGEPAVRAVG
jgi:pimeloyl-ACP methyl ester carboxylesterase